MKLTKNELLLLINSLDGTVKEYDSIKKKLNKEYSK